MQNKEKLRVLTDFMNSEVFKDFNERVGWIEQSLFNVSLNSGSSSEARIIALENINGVRYCVNILRDMYDEYSKDENLDLQGEQDE